MSIGVQAGEGVNICDERLLSFYLKKKALQSLKEYLTFPKERKYIKSLNQEVVRGALGLLTFF